MGVGRFFNGTKGYTMKKFTVFGTILTVPMLALAGVALAADPEPSAGSGASGPGAEADDMMNQTAPPMPSAQQTPARPGGASAQSAFPTDAVIGREVVNADGDDVGKISAITGDQVIVEVGGFLGIGTHGVALNWGDLRPFGSGDSMALQTSLTREEIKDLPEYTE